MSFNQSEQKAVPMLAARKSARIRAHLQKKAKQQEKEVPLLQNKRPKRKDNIDLRKRSQRKKDRGEDVSTKIKKSIKASAKSASKDTDKEATTPIVKATATTTAKTPAKATAKATTKVSDKTSTGTNSSGKSTSKSSFKTYTKRRTADTSSYVKRAKMTDTSGTTPRRKEALQASGKLLKKKNKNSPIQFDYGVPSPTETELESVDDEDSPSQILARAAQRAVIAKTKQGQSIRIQLDPSKAFKFRSERARKLWEAATKERADVIKGVIEKRDFVPDWLKRQLEGSLEFTASQNRNMLSEDKNRRTHGMLEWLKLEEKVLDLDAEIKSSLKKNFADTDVEKCIACLEKLLLLPVDPLMLKKYSQLTMTPCILQRYKGSLTEWILSREQKKLFCSKREVIWEKAKALQQKYMALFGIDDGEKYTEILKERLQVFQDSVSKMTEEEISLLVHDPSSKTVAMRKTVPST